jgi:hypothetical protein
LELWKGKVRAPFAPEAKFFPSFSWLYCILGSVASLPHYFTPLFFVGARVRRRLAPLHTSPQDSRVRINLIDL